MPCFPRDSRSHPRSRAGRPEGRRPCRALLGAGASPPHGRYAGCVRPRHWTRGGRLGRAGGTGCPRPAPRAAAGRIDTADAADHARPRPREGRQMRRDRPRCNGAWRDTYRGRRDQTQRGQARSGTRTRSAGALDSHCARGSAAVRTERLSSRRPSVRVGRRSRERGSRSIAILLVGARDGPSRAAAARRPCSRQVPRFRVRPRRRVGGRRGRSCPGPRLDGGLARPASASHRDRGCCGLGSRVRVDHYAPGVRPVMSRAPRRPRSSASRAASGVQSPTGPVFLGAPHA